MAKIADIFNAEVRVSGDFRYFSLPKNFDRAQAENILAEIKRQVERHVDSVKSVEIYIPEICEFCESRWEEEDGLPVCCTKAVVEAKKEK